MNECWYIYFLIRVVDVLDHISSTLVVLLWCQWDNLLEQSVTDCCRIQPKHLLICALPLFKKALMIDLYGQIIMFSNPQGLHLNSVRPN